VGRAERQRRARLKRGWAGCQGQQSRTGPREYGGCWSARQRFVLCQIGSESCKAAIGLSTGGSSRRALPPLSGQDSALVTSSKAGGTHVAETALPALDSHDGLLGLDDAQLERRAETEATESAQSLTPCYSLHLPQFLHSPGWLSVPSQLSCLLLTILCLSSFPANAIPEVGGVLTGYGCPRRPATSPKARRGARGSARGRHRETSGAGARSARCE
jgi:hypothetical protein